MGGWGCIAFVCRVAGQGTCAVLAKFVLIPGQRPLGLEWAEHTANRLDRKYLFNVASSRWLCFYAGGWEWKMVPTSSFVLREVPQQALKLV